MMSRDIGELPASQGKAVIPFKAELGNCVKVGVAVLGSPSLIVLLVSVDVKQH